MAYNYNGSTQKHYTTSTSIVTGYTFSVSAWFRTATTTQTNFLVAMGHYDAGVSTQWDAIVGRNDSKISAQSWDGSNNPTAATTTTYSANTWNNVVGVWQDATYRYCYLNGGGKGFFIQTTSKPQTNDAFAIAALQRSDDPAVYWDGDIAEVAVWDVALTDDEVAALGAGAPPILVRPQSLQAYFPLIRDLRELIKAEGLTAAATPTVTDHPPVTYFMPGFTQLAGGGDAPPAVDLPDAPTNLSVAII